MIIVKSNFYVFTGGPGGGKTTLLEGLGQMGHSCIDETARIIIKERISRGLAPRPSPLEFAEEIFNTDVRNYNANANSNEVIFFDRSFVDSAGMLVASGSDKIDKCLQLLREQRFNPCVFITPPWKEIYKTDSERDQTYEDSIRVYENCYQFYKENGYDLIILPKAPLEKRIRFVIDRIK